jgi:hypothetical protein
MALMLSSLYKALLEAGASEEKARKAAEEAAQYEARFHRVEADLSVLKWMVGTHMALTLVGFSLLANWVWQVLQRLPVKTP